MEPGGEVTQLLEAMHDGVPGAAERLLPLVYSELHRLAKAYMRGERPDHTLQPTALINEAYLRLLGDPMDWKNRGHFIGVAANAMRLPTRPIEEATEPGRSSCETISPSRRSASKRSCFSTT
jgi:hypothetical protein